MRNYEAVAIALRLEGVEVAFGMISGGVDELSRVLDENPAFRFVHVRHEEVAVGMADGYARATGKIGVAIVGSGPGLANSGAPMTAARMAKSRVLVIVNGNNPENRHGPMTTDQPPFLRATIGELQDCLSSEKLSENVALAFRHLRRGHGPVALQIAGSIVNAEMPVDWKYDPAGLSTVAAASLPPSAADIRDLAERVRASQRPVFLAGRGAFLANARSALIELSDRCGALLATSLLARDWFAGTPFNVGLSGGFAPEQAVEILRQADLVVAFGCRLTAETVGHGSLYPNARIVQVDVDPTAINDITRVEQGIVADARLAALALNLALPRIPRPDWRGDAMAARLRRIDRFRGRDLSERPGFANPRRVIEVCEALVPKERLLVIDIGLFMGVPGSYMTVTSPADIVFPWQLGRVGCALPVALGAAVGRPDRLVTAFIGDGGFMAALHALDTAKLLNRPILIFVMDDGGFGAERRIFQRAGFGAGVANYETPDLVAIAAALGFQGFRATSAAEVHGILSGIDLHSARTLVHVLIERDLLPTEMIAAHWA